jgi:hypothetical protein
VPVCVGGGLDRGMPQPPVPTHALAYRSRRYRPMVHGIHRIWAQPRQRKLRIWLR